MMSLLFFGYFSALMALLVNKPKPALSLFFTSLALTAFWYCYHANDQLSILL